MYTIFCVEFNLQALYGVKQIKNKEKKHACLHLYLLCLLLSIADNSY